MKSGKRFSCAILSSVSHILSQIKTTSDPRIACRADGSDDFGLSTISHVPASAHPLNDFQSLRIIKREQACAFI